MAQLFVKPHSILAAGLLFVEGKRLFFIQSIPFIETCNLQFPVPTSAQVLLRHGADPNANSRFVSYSSPFLAPLTEYLRWGVGLSGDRLNWDDDTEDRFPPEKIRYSIVHALLLYGAKVHFCAASTASRTKDPHGILHSVQFLREAPDVFKLLVSAATKVDLESVQAYSSLNEEERAVLLAVGNGPRDLRTIVHLFLRDYFRPNFPGCISALPLPEVVKRFLLFNPPLK